MIRIAPSILSADFGHLEQEIRDVTAAGADWIHVDVMDGSFVPNITLGPMVVGAARRATSLPLDVHLMIVDPDRHLDAFAHAGADVLTVHAEACTHLHRTLQHIAALGKKAGVALNPATPLSAVAQVLDMIDLLLIMSVNPGFGGQRYIQSMTAKIEEAAQLIRSAPRPIDLEVDGGINPETARAAIGSGANVLVAGNAVFTQTDYAAAICAIRGATP